MALSPVLTGSAPLAATLPGGWELLVILFIVLLLFGAKRLPDLAGSLGRSLREFRRSTSDAAKGPEGDAGPSDGAGTGREGDDRPDR